MPTQNPQGESVLVYKSIFCYYIDMKVRLPLTRFGLPQLVIFPLVTIAIMTVIFFIFRTAFWLFTLETILLLLLLWFFSFFRDPERRIILDENVLYAPADGVITGVDIVESAELGGKACRVGIFLSLFNVHVNRMPCAVRVEGTQYTKGAFKNAAAADAGMVNEANLLTAVRLHKPCTKLILRQVSGAIARHIVCAARVGDEFSQGERFGMIKFGSRTELYIPVPAGVTQLTENSECGFSVLVKQGVIVKGGLTPIVRYS
jgi:phosphatidylserine decarboxylase